MHRNENKDSFNVVASFMRGLLDDLKAPDENGVKDNLEKKLELTDPFVFSWKYALKKYDLLDKAVSGLSYKNGFEPNKKNDDTNAFTALYTNKNRRYDSGELFSFLLALQLQESNKPVTYQTAFFEAPYYDEQNKPQRYFIIKGKMVWFDPQGVEFRMGDDNSQFTPLGDFETALNTLLTM